MIFMGRKSYGAEMLKWSIEQGLDVIAVCTEPISMDNLIIRIASENGIRIVKMEEAETMDVDIVISYLYSKKIRKPLIENPKYGCINFHPAILPDWRGTAGYNVAIINKLSEWGATAHYVDESIDTGEIIRVYRFNFDYRLETATSLERKTQKIQQDLYKSVLTDVIEQGKLKSRKQFMNEGRYISRIEMEAMKKIDFEKDDVDLKIRAFWFPPYQGAYIEQNGKKYTLVNEEILDSLSKYGTGGGIT